MGNSSIKKGTLTFPDGGHDNDLTTDYYNAIAEIAKRIGGEWILVCIALGVKPYELDQINYDASLDVRTKIFKGLMCWLELRQEATEGELIKELEGALKDNGRHDLAADIKVILKENKAKLCVEHGRQRPELMTGKGAKSKISHYPESFHGRSISATQRRTIRNNRITVKEFGEKLYDMNYNETQRITVSPLQITNRMASEKIFAPISIREVLEYSGKGQNVGIHGKSTKTLNCLEDIFYIDGKIAGNVFILGDAAIGKSVFCLRLVENWCKANNPMSANKSSFSWVRPFKMFNFLFYVQLRHVDKSRTSVLDMICNDVFQRHPECHDVICRVISDINYRCLIVMDGLDEWKISDEAKQTLKVEGLPNIENMANCTFLWSMRSSLMYKFVDFIRGNDRVVEIQGLDTESVNIVIEKILVNVYALDKKSPRYREKVKEIKAKSQNSALKSIMQIPLMAIACIQIWYEENDIGNSMTNLYVALLNLLVKRSNQKTPLSANIRERLSEESSKLMHLFPRNFTTKKNVKDIFGVLLKLGRIAYEDLVANETRLVFSEDDIAKFLENYEMEFARKTGLLCQCEVPGSFYEENVSINFFHKTIQEFLAAIYIQSHVEISDFIKNLSSVKVIMELGNVLVFLSGINPMLGSTISQHIVHITHSDSELCRYRVFSDVVYHNNTVESLYKLQVNCYREVITQHENSGNTYQVVPYHVSDVCVDDDSDINTIRTTADILTHHHADIKSLLVDEVPSSGDNGITDTILTQCLDQTVSLQSLFLSGGANHNRTLSRISDRFSSLTALILHSITLAPEAISTLKRALQSNIVIQTLGLVDIKCQINKGQLSEPASLGGLIQIIPGLPRLSTLHIAVANKADKALLSDLFKKGLSHLHDIEYYYTNPRDAKYDRKIVQTLCMWPELRTLCLFGLSLGDSGLQLSENMIQVRTIWLEKVLMSATGWKKFVLSALKIKHSFNVTLEEVDIDERCVKMIQSSSHFRASYNEVDEVNGSRKFYFTRVWSPTTQNLK